MKIDPYLFPCTKLKSKGIKDLSINPTTLNLIEEKVGSSLQSMGTGVQNWFSGHLYLLSVDSYIQYLCNKGRTGLWLFYSFCILFCNVLEALKGWCNFRTHYSTVTLLLHLDKGRTSAFINMLCKKKSLFDQGWNQQHLCMDINYSYLSGSLKSRLL